MYLPKDTPDYWLKITAFATNDEGVQHILPSTVKVIVENFQLLNNKAFCTDAQLMAEIHAFPLRENSAPLGIVLVSNHTECGGKLLIHGDRAGCLVVYTKSFGTVTGTHYHKYCNQSQWTYRQYYGFHKLGDQAVMDYDSEWGGVNFFVSTSETAIEMSILRCVSTLWPPQLQAKSRYIININTCTTRVQNFAQLWIIVPQPNSKHMTVST